MSDEMEQFEKHLQRQSLGRPPGEWRQDILAAAQAQTARRPQPVASGSWLARFNQRLTSLLWPHPVAWGGLAAIWIFIGALNFSVRTEGPAMAKATPPSPEVAAELKQQQRLFAELMGASDSPAADRQKPYVPKPRSESVGMLTA
jgi:hypothetical protein